MKRIQPNLDTKKVLQASPLQEWIPTLENHSLQAVLRLIAKRGDVRKVKELLAQSKAPAVDDFVSLIDTYTHAKQYMDVHVLFKRMQEKPDQCIFTSLMKNAMQCGHLDQVEPLVHPMTQEYQLNPDTQMFEVIIEGLTCAGELEKAKVCIDQMEQVYGLKPNVQIFNSFLRYYVKKNNVQQAENPYFMNW